MDILAGNWVLAMLLIQLVLWATWGFMAGTYGIYSLQKAVVHLPGEVDVDEVAGSPRLAQYTTTGVDELWRWLRS